MDELFQTILQDPKFLYGIPGVIFTLVMMVVRYFSAKEQLDKVIKDMEFSISSLEHLTSLTGNESWIFEYYRVIYDIAFKDELIKKIQESLKQIKDKPLTYILKFMFSNPFRTESNVAGFPASKKFFKVFR